MIRVPKVTISFEIEQLNAAGLVVDSRQGTVKLHEAGYGITVSDLVDKLKAELVRSQTQGDGKDAEDNG